MKKILIALFVILLPSVSLAQTSITVKPVGTCQQIQNGYWQQMPDGTWASPGDKLNTCTQNGNVWNYGSQYGSLGSQSQYNPALANMNTSQWLMTCVLLSSILPQSQCQGYNPSLASSYNQLSGVSSLLQYPTAGRNYIAIGGANSQVTVSTDSSSNFWKTALIGVGMGWLLNRLTS